MSSILRSPRLVLWLVSIAGSTFLPMPVAAIVFDLRTDGTSLFAGGDFDAIDGVDASRIARWDGTRWTALGTGIAGGDVRSLAFHAENLVAGGSFTTAGGNPAPGIAVWNGTAWSTLGGGIAGTVRTLVTFGTDLVAGGSFATTGNGPACNIARWDGAMWHPLGEGVRQSPGASDPSEVAALAVLDGILYAIGTFDSAGVSAASNIARWDGVAWSPLGEGLCDVPAPLPVGSDLAVLGTAIVATGCFSCVGSLAAHHAARWDGAAWSDMGFEFPALCPEFEVEVLDGMLFAGGVLPHPANPSTTSIVRWDGSAWVAHARAPEPYRRIETLAGYGGQLIAGGSFEQADGAPVPGIAAWNGNRWQALQATPTAVATDPARAHRLLSVAACENGVRARLQIAPPGAVVSLRLVDVRGRLRGRFDGGWHDPGESVAFWNMHPNRGVYWVLFDAETSHSVRRLTWIEPSAR